MTHRVRSAFGRFLALSGGFAIALVIATSPLVAQQTTGKIEGTVTDQAGVPVANAQVFVVGTSFGANSNDKGYYFINNVPVGTYTLRGQFIGYAPAEVRNVRVQGGQTATVNIKMQSSAVVLTGVTVTAAANPIVPRDQVTSKFIVGGDRVGSLPVDDVRQVVSLSPGVVESGDANGVSIRGGRPGEANVYIDGAPVRQSQSGAQGTASCRRLTSAAGSLAGATTANQPSMSTSGQPCSAIVGTSGSEGTRCLPITPMARSAPLFKWPCTAGTATTPISTWPPIRSAIIGPTPLYGMWRTSTPAASTNISPARWMMVPLPDDA